MQLIGAVTVEQVMVVMGLELASMPFKARAQVCKSNAANVMGLLQGTKAPVEAIVDKQVIRACRRGVQGPTSDRWAGDGERGFGIVPLVQ